MKGSRGEPKVTSTVEEVDAEPRKVERPEPAKKDESKAETPEAAPAPAEAKPSLIPLKVFCLHKTGGKIDQAQAFMKHGEKRKFGRRTWADWEKLWDEFQKREIK